MEEAIYLSIVKHVTIEISSFFFFFWLMRIEISSLLQNNEKNSFIYLTLSYIRGFYVEK